MKKMLFITVLVFILGVFTSIFRHKIVAGSAAVVDAGKILFNMINDSEKAVRAYINDDVSNQTLVNPGHTFMMQIRSGDTVKVYSPVHNTTFRVSINEQGRKELLGREVSTSVSELRDATSERTASGFGFEEEQGATKYLDIVERNVDPYENIKN